MDINIQIEDLGLLYKVDVINYNKNIGTPIGDHINRVGLLFYEKKSNIITSLNKTILSTQCIPV